MIENGKWMFNIHKNNENWQSDTFDTKEEAIEAGLREYHDYEKDHGFYEVGKIEKHVPHIDGERIIEWIGDTAYEECGDFAEDYLRRVKQGDIEHLTNRLNEVLIEWLKGLNEMPTFGKMTKVEKINVGQQKSFTLISGTKGKLTIDDAGVRYQ